MPESVLTIEALDLGIDKYVNYMAHVCRRFAVSDGRRQVRVPSLGLLDPTGAGSIAVACDSLDRVIRATPGPKIVLGYSQGAQVAGAWLRKYAHRADAPPAADLSFVLIGNPERRHGKQPWTEKTTPDWTQYTVRDVARRGDNWADWQGKTRSRFLSMFGKIHNNYWNVDVYDTSAETVAVNGNTTYVRVP